MECTTGAGGGLHEADEGQRSGREEGRQEVEVRFYGPDSFKGLHRKPIERLSPLIHRILLGGGPWHCNIEYEGMIYDCNTYHGCTVYLDAQYDLEPTARFPLLAHFDRTWFMESRKFQVVQTLLDLLGFVPAAVRPINCIQATALAVGIRVRCRTPRNLLEAIQRWDFSRI